MSMPRSNTTSVVEQSFSVEIGFPIYFTRDVFGAGNRVLADAVTRVEPGQRHRLLFVLDGSVVEHTPSLLSQLDRYVTGHPKVLELAGEPVIVPGGEGCKNDLTQSHRVLAQINARGIDRHSFVVVVGGGAVIDMACFAAALAHRGVRAIRIPTTVVSQGDSGVGVKNANQPLRQEELHRHIPAALCRHQRHPVHRDPVAARPGRRGGRGGEGGLAA